MASSSPVYRRSVSQPVTRTASAPDPQIEVLYNLPSVRIVAFTTPSSIYRPSLSHGSPVVEDAPGTLPWVSRFERTIAVGPLRIYRAPGSVAFLSCANALQPILPKSQSWLVDGDSKFVLQIRRPSYWRIEVPNETAEEKTRVEELKEVLSKVLLFEKTPCPFKRDFVIELPEAPQTPVKKRPWKPVEQQQTGRLPSPESKYQEDKSYISRSPGELVTAPTIGRETESKPIESPPESPKPLSEADSNISLEARSRHIEPLDNEVVGDSTSQEEKEHPSSSPSMVAPSLDSKAAAAIPGSDLQEEESDNFSDATDDTNITPRSYFQPKYQPMIFEPDSNSRPPAMQNCSRSITAPPILSLVTSPPSKHRTKSPLGRPTLSESESDFSSSVDSFHSVQSWHSPLDPPSPQDSVLSSSQTYPYPHNDIVLPKRAHTRDISELTVTPETPETPGVWNSTAPSVSDSRSLSPPPKTPTLVNDASEKSDDEDEKPEAVTPPTVRPHFRHRATTSNNSRRRELSPLPAAVNLFSPPRRRSRRLQTAKHIPTAIIQTTCKILLSPPSHLLHLMLNIASKIAAGEWRGFLSNQGENVYWDFEQEYGRENWHEDDYGMSVPAKPQSPKKSPVSTGVDTGGSWEVD